MSHNQGSLLELTKINDDRLCWEEGPEAGSQEASKMVKMEEAELCLVHASAVLKQIIWDHLYLQFPLCHTLHWQSSPELFQNDQATSFPLQREKADSSAAPYS